MDHMIISTDKKNYTEIKHQTGVFLHATAPGMQSPQLNGKVLEMSTTIGNTTKTVALIIRSGKRNTTHLEWKGLKLAFQVIESYVHKERNDQKLSHTINKSSQITKINI